MPTIVFPVRHLASLQDMAGRVLERRAVGAEHEAIARDLLAGFGEVCMQSGLDGVLVEIGASYEGLDTSDPDALAADERVRGPLVTMLGNKTHFDEGGPRNAKPRQLVDCLVSVMALAPTDANDQTTTLGDEVRTAVAAAITAVVDVELGVPRIRDSIVTAARAKTEERYLSAFDKIAAHLDDRAMRMVRQPKIPLDAVQAVQRVLSDVRTMLIERMASTAIDRAVEILARADAELAARIDKPITHTMTPRDVAIRRASDSRVAKVPAAVAHSLLESLADLLRISWRALEKVVRPYAASQTFAVGELIEHPKFGRGTVLSVDTQRMDVEFSEGKNTLVHARKP